MKRGKLQILDAEELQAVLATAEMSESMVSQSATDAVCIFNRLDWVEEPVEWWQRSAWSSYHGKAESGQTVPSSEAGW